MTRSLFRKIWICLNFLSFVDFSASVRYVTLCHSCHFAIFQSLRCRWNISLNKKCQILVDKDVEWTSVMFLLKHVIVGQSNHGIWSLNAEPRPVFRRNILHFWQVSIRLPHSRAAGRQQCDAVYQCASSTAEESVTSSVGFAHCPFIFPLVVVLY